MSQPPVESIDRALLVLDALARLGPDGAPLAVLADRVGVNKTTLHRALAALRHRDFVAQDPVTGVYRLGSAALTLADGYLAGDNLAASVHPALVALSAETDELVHLGVLAGAQIIYLDKVEPDRPVRVWSAVGRRRPAATTALGRALLLDRVPDRDALTPYLEPGWDAAVADRTWQEIERGRSAGFAVEREENEPGIACVALPLRRGGTTIAAVSVTAPRDRLPERRAGQVAQTMRRLLGERLPPTLSV